MCRPAYLLVLLCLILCGCSGESDVDVHPQITEAQIQKDAESGFPRPGADGAYEKGEIEILESNYSGDTATIVLTAGSVTSGSRVPAGADLKIEVRPQVDSIDRIPYKLRLDYQWMRGEWRLRKLDNLTFENR